MPRICRRCLKRGLSVVGGSKNCLVCGSRTENCTPEEIIEHEKQIGIYRSEPPMPRARGRAMTPLQDFQDNWG